MKIQLNDTNYYLNQVQRIVIKLKEPIDGFLISIFREMMHKYSLKMQQIANLTLQILLKKCILYDYGIQRLQYQSDSEILRETNSQSQGDFFLLKNLVQTLEKYEETFTVKNYFKTQK
ncbi:hypothetical protein ABPG72_018890 [Tetrahymena utriculariae]